ncbi:hypothetical protein EPO33_03990 [Patescibacteria group bacterium]|nr:MAG: hypothetical protein EPO33_03990 [Patescibacteria group bacterium]
MHLPDMPKRLIPFPLVLVAITGAFILVALYADVRGRERRAAETPAAPVASSETPVQTPEPAAATSTEVQPEEQTPEPLGLPPESPTSDIPAVAVFDCLRFEYRDNRLVVGDRFLHVATRKPALVDEKTLHLRCRTNNDVVRAPNGKTFFVSSAPPWPRDSRNTQQPETIAVWTVFEVNSTTGILREIARLPDAHQESDDLRGITVSDDGSFLVGELHVRGLPLSLLRIDTATGEIKRTPEHGSQQTILFTADRLRALGIEWRCGEGGDCFESLFLHRYNLETQQRVRVGELKGAVMGQLPVMLDDGRIVVPGEATPLFIVNSTTGRTAPIRMVTTKVDVLGVTTDGTTLVVSGPDLPLTAIPVAELPKP